MTSAEDYGVDINEWNRTVRRARLGRTVKAVALALATYADPDGTRVFPGIAQLAIAAEVTYNVAQTSLTKLRDYGLIERVKVGSRPKGKADEYRLILHADVLDRVEVLSPDQVRKLAETMTERRRVSHNKAPKPSDPGDALDPTACGPNGSSSDPSLDPTASGPNEQTQESSGPHGDGQTGSFGPHGGVPLDPTACVTTLHDQNTKSTLHSDDDLGADAYGPRAKASESKIGNGFCMVCYALGDVTLAADPTAGSACSHHLAAAA